MATHSGFVRPSWEVLEDGVGDTGILASARTGISCEKLVFLGVQGDFLAFCGLLRRQWGFVEGILARHDICGGASMILSVE